MKKDNHNSFKQIRGVTLFGLLLYIAFSSSVILAVSSLTMSVLKQNVQAEHNRSIMYALSSIHTHIGTALSESESVRTPLAGASATVLVLDSAGTEVTFFVEEGRLLKKVGAQEAVSVTPVQAVINSVVFESLQSKGAVPYIRSIVEIEEVSGFSGADKRVSTTTVTWFSYE